MSYPFIHFGALKNVADLLKRHFVDEIPDPFDSHVVFLRFFRTFLVKRKGVARFLRDNLSVEFCQNYVRVASADKCSCTVFAAETSRFDVEFVDLLFERDCYFFFFHHLFGFFDLFGSDIAQHFKLFCRVSARDAECSRDRKTNHPCSRNADTETVFDDVSAEGDLRSFDLAA